MAASSSSSSSYMLPLTKYESKVMFDKCEHNCSLSDCEFVNSKLNHDEYLVFTYLTTFITNIGNIWYKENIDPKVVENDDSDSDYEDSSDEECVPQKPAEYQLYKSGFIFPKNFDFKYLKSIVKTLNINQLHQYLLSCKNVSDCCQFVEEIESESEGELSDRVTTRIKRQRGKK